MTVVQPSGVLNAANAAVVQAQLVKALGVSTTGLV
ncbi:MAG: anti-anti-sigma factor, partial [Leptolyngbya sp. SIO4C5]|nr:anti-anti-sigma factor [Leptolyngbya sp. SIO4C5]